MHVAFVLQKENESNQFFAFLLFDAFLYVFLFVCLFVLMSFVGYIL